VSPSRKILYNNTTETAGGDLSKAALQPRLCYQDFRLMQETTMPRIVHIALKVFDLAFTQTSG
jgi:hypothetical protein